MRKLIFKTHTNSAVFNLRIKSIHGERIWIDKIKIPTDYKLLTKQTMIASFDGDTNVKCLYYKANFNVE